MKINPKWSEMDRLEQLELMAWTTLGQCADRVEAISAPINETSQGQLEMLNLALDALRKSEMFLADILNTKSLQMQSEEMRRQKSGIAIPAR